MKQGQTMIGTNGKQVLLFPMTYFNSLQIGGTPSGQISHCCNFAIDNGGGILGGQPIYAPCDCHLIYAYGGGVYGNERIWQSDDEVNYATGVGIVTFAFTHDSNPIYNTVGVHVKQGELIGHTGIEGLGSGDHVHIDQSLMTGDGVREVPSGIDCGQGFGMCYKLDGSVIGTDIWFVNDTELILTQDLVFKTYEGGIPGPTPSKDKLKKKKSMPLYMMMRKRPF